MGAGRTASAPRRAADDCRSLDASLVGRWPQARSRPDQWRPCDLRTDQRLSSSGSRGRQHRVRADQTRIGIYLSLKCARPGVGAQHTLARRATNGFEITLVQRYYRRSQVAWATRRYQRANVRVDKLRNRARVRRHHGPPASHGLEYDETESLARACMHQCIARGNPSSQFAWVPAVGHDSHVCRDAAFTAATDEQQMIGTAEQLECLQQHRKIFLAGKA